MTCQMLQSRAHLIDIHIKYMFVASPTTGDLLPFGHLGCKEKSYNEVGWLWIFEGRAKSLCRVPCAYKYEGYMPLVYFLILHLTLKIFNVTVA